MRLPLIAALPAVLLLAPPEFNGCGSEGDETPPDGLPLPPGDGCVTDADCMVDICMDVRCLAGECEVLGPTRDADGDGRAADPCGDDCDDGDPSTFAGAPERCDGRDNDCDGVVDDGAPRLDDTYQLMVGDPSSVVFPWGPSFLVTEATPSVLWGVPVGPDGAPGAPLELMRLSMGTRFDRVAGAQAADGRLLVTAATDFGVVRWVVVERDAATGDARRVMGPGTLPTPPDVRSLEVLPFQAGWAIAYDGTTTFGTERLVALDPTAEPVIHLPMSTFPESFGFATDGTHVVLTDELGNVVFFDPDGTEAARHMVAASLPARPLASAAGSVVVVRPDDFDFVLGRVDLAAGVSAEEHPAPFGDSTDVVRIATAGDLVVVSRGNFTTTSVQALRDDLSTYEGSGILLGSGGAGEVSRFSVAESNGAVAVLGALSSAGRRSDLGVLLGCAGGS